MRTLPTNLITPVKAMSKAAIRSRALEVLQRLSPESLERPRSVPILRIIEEDLELEFGYRFGIRQSHWAIEGGARPREHPDGAGISLSQDRFDLLVRDNVSARFMAAHELGHIFLHIDQLLVEWRDEIPVFVGQVMSANVKPYRNPEWQANAFASQLLVPEPCLQMALNKFGPDERRLADLFKVPADTIDFRISSRRAA